MRKLLLTICLLAATLGFAQSPGITVTGTLKDAQGNPNAGTVTLTLANHGAGPATVGGTYAILNDSVSAQAATDGTFSISVYGNYQLDQHGTYYSLAFYTAGSRAPISTARYVFTVPGSFNVSALVPYTTSPSGPVATPGFMTSAGAATISGLWAFTTSPTVPDPTTNLQVANKEYVDANAGGISAGVTNNFSAVQNFNAGLVASTISAGTGLTASSFTSGQGVWEHMGSVIFPNPYCANPWTEGEITVIPNDTNPVILTAFTTAWKAWFTAGNTVIGYAESQDGVKWYRKDPTTCTPILSGVGNQSSVIKDGSGTYHLYVDTGASNIDEYTATDGVTFTLAHSAIIPAGQTVSNTSEIFTGGTLYMFGECSGGMCIWTSPDYHTMTLANVVTGSYKGPSIPYQVNGTWYMWVHTDNTGAGSAYTGSQIVRLSSSSLTSGWQNSRGTSAGPWTAWSNGLDYYQSTDDEGINLPYTLTPSGQVADPYVVEANGKVYLYYTSNYNDGTHNYSQIKLAIADMPMAQLVTTNGGVKVSSLKGPEQIPFWYNALDASVDFRGFNLENLGTGTILPRNFFIGAKTGPQISSDNTTTACAGSGGGTSCTTLYRFHASTYQLGSSTTNSATGNVGINPSAGGLQVVNATGNVVYKLGTGFNGNELMTTRFCQDATGGRTLTYDSTQYAGPIGASPAASVCTDQPWVYTGSKMRATAPAVDDLGGVYAASFTSTGTKFTTSGCSVSATTGGATAGVFTLGANTCTVVVTLNGATGSTAPNGWTCQAHDRTAPTVLIGGESSSTTTTASITIPAGAGTTDVISFSCMAY